MKINSGMSPNTKEQENTTKALITVIGISSKAKLMATAAIITVNPVINPDNCDLAPVISMIGLRTNDPKAGIALKREAKKLPRPKAKNS